MTRLRLTLAGRAYNVVVENIAEPLVPTAAMPLETAAMSFGPAPHVLAAAAKLSDAGPAAAGAVLSPLAGKVVSIDVRVGESVAEGAQVATIEAMKMNTYVFAPMAGKVAFIDAQPGDAVEDGAVLIRLG